MKLLRLSPARAFLLVGMLLLPAGWGAALATSVCDTDPNAVDFQATVDPNKINSLLAALGRINSNPPGGAITLSGFCVDHQIDVDIDLFSFPVAGAPFTITPSPGSIQVNLDVMGPFGIDVDGSRYRSVNCSSSCRISLPYVGEIFNGCSIEAGIVGPVLGLLHGSATWDSITVTQIADTCVLGNCMAVSPLEFSDARINGFDIDLTGFGSCRVALDFPSPIPDPPAFDPCDGIDPLIAALVQPLIDGTLDGAFVNRKGEGLLVNALSIEIVKDFGCLPIPEVTECKANQTTQTDAGLGQTSESRYANLALGLIPVVFALGLARSFRKKKD